MMLVGSKENNKSQKDTHSKITNKSPSFNPRTTKGCLLDCLLVIREASSFLKLPFFNKHTPTIYTPTNYCISSLLHESKCKHVLALKGQEQLITGTITHGYSCEIV